jgi:DNA-directed RNA polymerase subunit N (RpoN/RPB10)
MIIPIRCFSCGKPVAHKWETFKENVSKGSDIKKELDGAGLKRQCCRALFMGHIDTIDIISKYKRG